MKNAAGKEEFWELRDVNNDEIVSKHPSWEEAVRAAYAIGPEAENHYYIEQAEAQRQERGVTLLHETLPQHASAYEWVCEQRGVHSFRNEDTGGFLHMKQDSFSVRKGNRSAGKRR